MGQQACLYGFKTGYYPCSKLFKQLKLARADAICDRIVHSAHRIELNGESVRKIYAQKQQGRHKSECVHDEHQQF